MSRPASRRLRLKLALAGTALLGGTGAAFAFVASPGIAARIAQNPDMQILVFLVPLALMMAVMVFEAARMVWRGQLPAESPRRVRVRQHWSANPELDLHP